MSGKLVSLLMEHEKSVAHLYTIYAELFPEYRSFWDNLVREEERHIQIVADLFEKVDNQTIFLNEARFKERPLELSLNYIKEVTEKASMGNITMINALSVARDIEGAFIDSKFYEIFAGDSVWFKHYMSRLEQETRAHRQSVHDLLLKIKDANS